MTRLAVRPEPVEGLRASARTAKKRLKCLFYLARTSRMFQEFRYPKFALRVKRKRIKIVKEKATAKRRGFFFYYENKSDVTSPFFYIPVTAW